MFTFSVAPRVRINRIQNSINGLSVTNTIIIANKMNL